MNARFVLACLCCSFSVLAGDEEPTTSENPSQPSPSATAQAEETTEAQTSPKGTFKIRSGANPEGAEGETVSDFVVSPSDPNRRELLHQHPDTTLADYYISPDENWIYDQARYGHLMCGGEIFKRAHDIKFEPVLGDFDDAVWSFFAKQEGIARDEVPYVDSGEGIIDFVAWSPDSVRLLLDLRVGDFDENDRSRGIYKWYLYFNTRMQNFEVTDYLRRLNKGAWKRWKNFDGLKSIFPEAVSAEPGSDLPLQAELKKRYDEADRRLNESYQQILAKIDKQQQTDLRDDQRHWIKTRDAGAKFYKELGGKSTPEQRYWQYMLDSTEAQLHHLKADWKPMTESQ
jgi:uncharacterized protein YecT (DUF1311 family)